MSMISLLYVDDEQDLLSLGKLFLEKGGDFTVTTTTSPEEVIRMVSGESFDAIISDYQMPGMDGIELLKRVRGMGLSIPFILFTGKGREEVVIEAINNGADFYLQKGGDARSQFAELRHKILAALERHHAVDALRESEAKYRELVENAGSIILKLDKDGRIIFFNEYAQRFFGFTSGEILGRPVIGTIVPPRESETDRDLSSMIGEIIRHPEHYVNNENENITKSGNLVWVHWWNKPIFGRNGELEGILCVGTDFTERKRVEDDLRVENDKNRGLMNNASDAIFIMDAGSGMITDANRKAQEMLGRSLSELRAMHFTMLHPAEAHALCTRYFSRTAEEGTASYTTEIVSGEGRLVPVMMNSTAMDLGGRRHIMEICHDISEIRMAQDALQLANRKLNLLAEITRHDIRNKLTVLGGYLELIRDPPREPEYSMYFRKIHELVGIVSENIEFTKLYQNLGEVAPDWQNVHDAFFHSCARVDIRRICVQSDTGGMEVFADPLLERAFYNLVENAVLHGGNVTTIRISAREDANGGVITVDDDGMGIPSTDKAKIFSKGYGKNTGLGLFLVQEILSITGITIMENGEYRKGARFELHIPPGAYRYPGKKKDDRCHIRMPGQGVPGG